jgi:protein-tyrosine phosphatase
MEHVFWMIQGRLAGRAGPNREPWDLRALVALGIDSVLTLNDGAGCDPAELEALGFEHCSVPLPPSEPPEPGDDEVCRAGLPVAYEFVAAQHVRGRAVLVHCSAGKDRTGLFMSYYLVRTLGLDVETAIARVREKRPRAMTALGWEDLSRRVLETLRESSSR